MTEEFEAVPAADQNDQVATRDRSDPELLALEPISHRLPRGADRADIEALFDDDFFEIGASGKVYSRDLVVDVVEQRYLSGVDPRDDAWEIDSFATRALTDDLSLVTYRISFAGRLSRRSTLWRRHATGWRAVYHQGTLCEPDPEPGPDTDPSRPAN